MGKLVYIFGYLLIFFSIASAQGELKSFDALVNGKDVTLNWATTTEINSNGFEVQKMINISWDSLTFVKGAGNSTTTIEYSYVDTNAGSGKIIYRLKLIDTDGSFSYSSAVEVNIISSIEGDVNLTPTQFSLSQNYPNPFNPSTTINYSITKAGNVKITVYNAIGSTVATIVNEYKPAGNYSVQFNGTNLSSGIYLYRLESGNYNATRKLIFLK